MIEIDSKIIYFGIFFKGYFKVLILLLQFFYFYLEKKKLKRIPEVKMVYKKNAAGKLMKYPPGATHYSMTPSSYTQVKNKYIMAAFFVH